MINKKNFSEFIHHDKILILDFGSQYTKLIARRIRELGVYCEIFPYDVSGPEIKKFAPKGIILSGGPKSVTIQNSPRAPQIVFELGCPVLGICYGMQTMALQLQGTVAGSKKQEYGHARFKKTGRSKLFEKIPNQISVWMSHGDKVTKLSPGFRVIGCTKNTSYAAFEHQEKNFFGLQFHPEVTHTKLGKKILKNFVLLICACKRRWTTNNIICDIVQRIKNTAGNDKVVLGLSGGVDSAVAALLLHKAIGKNLICVFVDTGLLRYQEADQVKKIFSKHFKLKIIYVDAQRRFLRALAGITDPEKKRKIIGHEFINVFSQEVKKIPQAQWLAQGTICSDVIESAQTKFKKTEAIKSHHNVGGLPKKMHLKLLEPLRELFKDEVRKVGLKFGLNKEIMNRHPFPGPGLSVRIMGEIKPLYVDKLRQADNIFIEELHTAGLYDKVSQAFAVFIPVKSVGVTGDQRRYEHVIGLRAVKTIDFMTAHWVSLPGKFLAKVSGRIVNEVPGVSRVVYDITGKPPATIEWE